MTPMTLGFMLFASAGAGARRVDRAAASFSTCGGCVPNLAQ
jgi:hypothetical protein